MKKFKEEKSRVSEPIAYIDISKNDDFDIDCKEDYSFIRNKLLAITKNYDGMFKKIELRTDDEDYFRYTTDPDGNKRNLINEDEGRCDFAKNEISFLDKLLLPNMKLLDIGCGTMAITKKYKEESIEHSM